MINDILKISEKGVTLSIIEKYHSKGDMYQFLNQAYEFEDDNVFHKIIYFIYLDIILNGKNKEYNKYLKPDDNYLDDINDLFVGRISISTNLFMILYDNCHKKEVVSNFFNLLDFETVKNITEQSGKKSSEIDVLLRNIFTKDFIKNLTNRENFDIFIQHIILYYDEELEPVLVGLDDETKKTWIGINDGIDSFLDVVTNIVETPDIKNEIILILDGIERQNRIKNILWNGEKRQKDLIYYDTIKNYIKEFKISSTKYSEKKVVIPPKEVTLPDGTKIMTKEKIRNERTELPTDKITQKYLSVLSDLLDKTKDKGFIHISDSQRIEKYDKDDDEYNAFFVAFSNFLDNDAKYKISILPSNYIGQSTQTLLHSDKKQKNYILSVTNIVDFLYEYRENFPYAIETITDFMISNNLRHQKSNIKRAIDIGFIKYHPHNNKIFVNTIQSDISYIMNMKEESVINETNDIYYHICLILLRNFIKTMHQKDYTEIVIPLSKTRDRLFPGGNHAGFSTVYDDIPRRMGFTKIKFEDTIWYGLIEQYYMEKDIEIQFEQYMNRINRDGIDVWELRGLNESLNLTNKIKLNESNKKDFIKKIKGLSKKDIIQYDFDKEAFGFSVGDIIEIKLKDLIPNYDDLSNTKDVDMKVYFENKTFNSLPYIEVKYKDKKFYIEDGHHRYAYAKKLKLNKVKVKVTSIDDNPIKSLGFNSIDEIIKEI